VEVCGLNAQADALELKRRIGVLPEDLGLFDDLTVEEHLLLTGSVYGVDRHETRSRTDQLLHALSLGHGRNTFAVSCSHGMRKKTAFAMALLPNPRALFLDEPFEAIDPVTSKIMRDLLVAAARRGVTVFLTSHILSVVDQIATQVVMIRKGKIVWNSPPGDLPQSLEQHYFDLVESPVVEDLKWLGPARS
jgi:ABC-2 type transport system ATP-binding protein